MVRFRIGQGWKREASKVPKDSFGLYIDEIDLLCGATDESLAVVVPDLVDALANLFLDGDRLAQVSLAEAHSELVFHRRDGDVDVSVVSLARPAKQVRPPVRIDLERLRKASAACAHTLMQDLREVSPGLLKSPKIHRMTRKLLLLEHAASPAPLRNWAVTGYSYRIARSPECSFGFELLDPEDLLLERGGSAALPSLLCQGTVQLWLGGASEPAWERKDLLFLVILELSRQGSDLCQAMELGDAQFSFTPAGQPPTLHLDLERQELQADASAAPTAPAELARAIFELGLAVSFAITTRNKRQAKNPYLLEIADRCHEGLAVLRASYRPSPSKRPAKGERKSIPAAASRPLQQVGRLRRLRYLKRWEKHKLGGKDHTRLLLGSQGPVVSCPEMVCAFDPEGRLRYHHLGIRGVAASADGYSLTASAERVAGFRGKAKSADWVRDHDGTMIGPELERRAGLLISQSESRSVFALSEVTGRAIWRMVPPRAARIFWSLQGHRLLIATESGVLFGLDLADGQICYRVRGGPPFIGPAVAWGRKFLALTGRGDRYTLLAADSHAGNIQWTYPVSLSSPSSPLPQRHGVLVAGEDNDGGVLTRLNASGQPVWSRKLLLGHGPFALASVASSVVVCSRSGGATLFAVDGEQRWHIPPTGGELPVTLAPGVVRGVLIIPGEVVRAVDPSGGEILAELRAGIGLCDLKVDSHLNLYLLDEEGSLKCYRLASHFTVVRAPA